MQPLVKKGVQRVQAPVALIAAGDITTDPVVQVVASPIVKIGGAAGAAFHGYKRSGSVAWTLAWAALGAFSPVLTLAVAAAQGYGKPKRDEE